MVVVFGSLFDIPALPLKDSLNRNLWKREENMEVSGVGWIERKPLDIDLLITPEYCFKPGMNSAVANMD
jgi:hypothetical protein